MTAVVPPSIMVSFTEVYTGQNLHRTVQLNSNPSTFKKKKFLSKDFARPHDWVLSS